MNIRRLIIAATTMLATAASAAGLDHVKFTRDEQTIEISGTIIVEPDTGGVLLIARDGVLWTVQPDELIERRSDETPFAYYGKDEIAEQLLAEMPKGFHVHQTARYVICYNTSKAYGQWCGALYERLFRGFYGYWRNRDVTLHDPELPLVALVFDSKESYVDYAKSELGAAAGSTIGYYSLRTNRVIMYDLTGTDSSGSERSTAARINLILSQPAAERTVATIVHEATHQLAFNSGLQSRYADVPVWLSEGLAMYFETPDLRSSRGWRTIGAVNQFRLAQFRAYMASRPADSLTTLLSDNKRFGDANTAIEAYAESWALNYFLMRTREEQYVEYLQRFAQKEPLDYDEADERIELFKDVFGQDLESLDAEFLRAIQRIR